MKEPTYMFISPPGEPVTRRYSATIYPALQKHKALRDIVHAVIRMAPFGPVKVAVTPLPDGTAKVRISQGDEVVKVQSVFKVTRKKPFAVRIQQEGDLTYILAPMERPPTAEVLTLRKKGKP